MQKITIAEILKGVTTGRLQSVGYMQVIPLISELVDESFSPPDDIYSSTSNYGTLEVENRGDSMTIFPFGAGIMTKSAAQNHATPIAKVVMKGRKAVINKAACIQETQGGVISSGKHKMTILPWSIKESAMMTKDQTAYQKLWPAIREFNQNLGVQNMGHMEFYLEKFKDELDTFVAEFEVVPNQVGAIILMNGFVMGIERAPNYSYWKSLWTPLIRECYGSLALQYTKQFGSNPPPPKTRIPLKSTGIKTFKDIRVALDKARKQEEENVRGIIRAFVKDKFTRKEEEKMRLVESGNTEIAVESLTHRQFTGQIVRKDETIIYTSLVTTGKWVKNKDWHEASEFQI